MTRIPIKETQALAERYSVTGRTIHRWRRAGCDVNDPASVANHLLKLRNPSPKAIQATRKLLHHENHTNTHRL